MSAEKVDLTFPALVSGQNRPVTWCYQLDGPKGETKDRYSNSVTILSRPVIEGEFSVVTLTRAEIVQILATLDADLEQLRKHCPEIEFY